MNSETAEPTFNLLSIGQRGVGKTVFLVGSYTELHADSQTKYKQKLWFDCQERQVQEKLDRIVNYIFQNGHYPPPTMNITNFNFTLKRRRLLGTQTLCHFHWSDIPGEICSIHNSDFRAMVTNSDGCCVFIDAYALVHNNNIYLQYLEEIVKQVMAIASLAYLHDLKYPFVVILTKCDLLEPSRSHQLNQFLEPLTTRLDAVKASYQTFYSLIPIVCTPDAVTLKPTGAAAPLLWLAWELSQSDNLGLMQNRLEVVPHLRSNILQAFQELVSKLLRSRVKVADQAVKVKQKQVPGLHLLPTARTRTRTRNSFLVLAVSIVALVGIGGLAYRYTKLTQKCSGLIKCPPAAKSPAENIRQTTAPVASFGLPSNSRSHDSTK